MRLFPRRRLSMLLTPAAVSLYLIAAACGGGDDAATITATPVSTHGASATASAAVSAAPATSRGALANTPASSGDLQVELLDSGFTALRGGLQGGFIAHNKDKTEAVAVSYNIPFLDSAGANLGGAYGTLVLAPDEKLGVAFGGSYDPANSVARIDVQIGGSDRRVPLPSTAHLTTAITSTETQSVSGTVTNPFSVDSQSLWMNVITYNAAGKIIGGNTVGIPSVPAMSTAGFTAQVPFVGDNYANNAHVEAYAEFRDSLPPGLTTQ